MAVNEMGRIGLCDVGEGNLVSSVLTTFMTRSYYETEDEAVAKLKPQPMAATRCLWQRRQSTPARQPICVQAPIFWQLSWLTAPLVRNGEGGFMNAL